MIIKAIEIKDLEAMVKIEQENFTEPWDFKILYYEAIKNTKTSFFGAYIDEILVGYIGFWAIIDNVDIINLAVSNIYKRQGIATDLFIFVEAIAQSLKVKSITLEVNVNNVAAYKLYKKLGFTVVRKISNYYYKLNEDAYLMQKEVVYE